ncbi:hypothetical protein FQN54_007742 [Arachnomyces sp. PD_36]|nr:hypothetical protein FQN54_007742 [Arachnomyces sp. PD_36]
MGINWQDKESTDRLIGAMLAAHPGFKPNYGGMAKLFGRGATYDAMEGRFRTYRKHAETLKREAATNGININEGTVGGRSGGGTPRTPRSGKGGVSKSGGKKGDSSTAKSLKTHFDTTPTKPGKSGPVPGTNRSEAIALDESDDDNMQVKKEIKKEMADLLFGSPAKPKLKKRQSTRLFDIASENASEKVDSQSNGYVAPPESEPEVDDSGSDYEFNELA